MNTISLECEKRRFTLLLCVSLCCGMVVGLLCAQQFQQGAASSLFSCDTALLLLSERSFFRLFLLSALFPSLLLLFSQLSFSGIFVNSLFFFRGYCLAYYLSLFTFDPKLFICALISVLFHGFLPLPLHIFAAGMLRRKHFYELTRAERWKLSCFLLLPVIAAVLLEFLLLRGWLSALLS